MCRSIPISRSAPRPPTWSTPYFLRSWVIQALQNLVLRHLRHNSNNSNKFPSHSQIRLGLLSHFTHNPSICRERQAILVRRSAIRLSYRCRSQIVCLLLNHHQPSLRAILLHYAELRHQRCNTPTLNHSRNYRHHITRLHHTIRVVSSVSVLQV